MPERSNGTGLRQVGRMLGWAFTSTVYISCGGSPAGLGWTKARSKVKAAKAEGSSNLHDVFIVNPPHSLQDPRFLLETKLVLYAGFEFAGGSHHTIVRMTRPRGGRPSATYCRSIRTLGIGTESKTPSGSFRG